MDNQGKKNENCAFKKVANRDIPRCTWQSFTGVTRDFMNSAPGSSKRWEEILETEDRIYYILASLAIMYIVLRGMRK